jgi:predicted permease
MTLDRLRQIIRLRLRSLVSGSAVDRELDDELRYHVEQQIDANIANGMTPDAARTAALRAIGGLEQRKEECRDQRGVTIVESTIQDTRHAWRVLQRSPVFAAVAVSSLALGLGVFMAIFQLVDAIRLRPLPIADAHELVEIKVAGGRGGWGVTQSGFAEATTPLWEALRAEQHSLSEIFAWSRTNVLVGRGPDAEPARALLVSGEMFPALRVKPVRGRLLSTADDQPGCAGGVVLSHAYWQTHFGGDVAIVGRAVTVLQQPFDVVGVAPPEFTGLEVGQGFDVAMPICAATLFSRSNDRRDYFWLTVMGRLAPGVTLAQAAEDVRGLSPGLFESLIPEGYSAPSLEQYRAFRYTAEPASHGVSRLRTTYATPLTLLFGTTGLILLLTTGNLATLMLARGSARRREFAMLVALGAARRRLIAQIVAEALMLSAAGVALAVPIALLCSRTMIQLLSTEGNELLLALDPDWRLLMFGAGVAVITALAFGLGSALPSSRFDPLAVLRSGRSVTHDRSRAAFQRALVIGQLAVCFVLIVSSLLFVRSFRNLSTIDVGFNPADLQVIRFADPYMDRLPMPRRLVFQQQLIDEIASMPGVESAAAITQVPLGGSSWGQGFTFGPANTRAGAKFTYASAGLFETLQIPIRRGRGITALDTPAAKPVAIVNDAFIRKFLGTGEAIGTTLRTVGEAGYPPTVYEIVGVVGDIKYGDLREDLTPIVYIPLMQVPTLTSWKSVMLRTRLTRAAVTDEAKRRISRLNPELRIAVGEMPVQLRERLVRERMLAWLAGAFGVLAITLAAVGLYGLIAYLSLSRRAEIGLRLALGARRSEVISLMMSQTLWLVACGVAGGAALSLVTLRGVRALLVGLDPSDPTTLMVAGLTVGVIAAVASLVPAIRASRVDPMTTLRAEES